MSWDLDLEWKARNDAKKGEEMRKKGGIGMQMVNKETCHQIQVRKKERM